MTVKSIGKYAFLQELNEKIVANESYSWQLVSLA